MRSALAAGAAALVAVVACASSTPDAPPETPADGGVDADPPPSPPPRLPGACTTDRDLDGDGEPDGHCVPGGDCDDLDPAVGHGQPEICSNGRDDDCDGTIDETGCEPLPEVDAGPPRTNVSCATARDIALDTLVRVPRVEPPAQVASTCGDGQTGALTYAFTLAEPRDVRILPTRGTPAISLREASCAERACRSGSSVLARSLPAGRWIFTVAGSADVIVHTAPPTTPPPESACETAPALAPDTVSPVVPVADATLLACLPAPSAVRRLVLAEASDVLVVGRFAPGETGAIALTGADCAGPVCTAAATSPLRIARPDAPPGEYRVLLASARGSDASIAAFTRPALPVTTVRADGCAAPWPIPATGGRFAGDTSTATADFAASCDALGQPPGGAPDELLELTLTERRRVVLDMSGSSYTTLLSVRRGTCPGVEVEQGCSTAGASQAFRDLVLDAGRYFVQIDGFGGSSGAWNLDVRIVPP